jgi:hypothetical protein
MSGINANVRPTPIHKSIYASFEGTKKYSEMYLAINSLSVSISTTLPGDLNFTLALNLYNQS